MRVKFSVLGQYMYIFSLHMYDGMTLEGYVPEKFVLHSVKFQGCTLRIDLDLSSSSIRE